MTSHGQRKRKTGMHVCSRRDVNSCLLYKRKKYTCFAQTSALLSPDRSTPDASLSSLLAFLDTSFPLLFCGRAHLDNTHDDKQPQVTCFVQGSRREYRSSPGSCFRDVPGFWSATYVWLSPNLQHLTVSLHALCFASAPSVEILGCTMRSAGYARACRCHLIVRSDHLQPYSVEGAAGWHIIFTCESMAPLLDHASLEHEESVGGTSSNRGAGLHHPATQVELIGICGAFHMRIGRYLDSTTNRCRRTSITWDEKVFAICKAQGGFE